MKLSILAAAALAAASVQVSTAAMAMPSTAVHASTASTSGAVEQVRWGGRGGWRGGGWGRGGWGVGAGLLGGALLGSALAAPYYYDSGPYYSRSYGYGYRGGDDGYCASRFRSYDPASGTYLGYDGIRHPCP